MEIRYSNKQKTDTIKFFNEDLFWWGNKIYSNRNTIYGDKRFFDYDSLGFVTQEILETDYTDLKDFSYCFNTPRHLASRSVARETIGTRALIRNTDTFLFDDSGYLIHQWEGNRPENHIRYFYDNDHRLTKILDSSARQIGLYGKSMETKFYYSGDTLKRIIRDEKDTDQVVKHLSKNEYSFITEMKSDKQGKYREIYYLDFW